MDLQNVAELKLEGKSVDQLYIGGKLAFDGINSKFVFTTIDGKKHKYGKSKTGLTIQYISTNYKVISPYKENASLSNSLSVAELWCKNKDISSLGRISFFECTNISSIYLPNITNIDECALAYTKISSIEFPGAISVGNQAFMCNGSLLSAYLPNATYFGEIPFEGCSSLTSIYVSNDVLHSIGNGFGNQHSLIVSDNERILHGHAYGVREVSNDTIVESWIDTDRDLATYPFIGSDISTMIMTGMSVVNPWDISYLGTEMDTENYPGLSVSMPNLKTVGEYAFYGTKFRGKQEFRNLLSIDIWAFAADDSCETDDELTMLLPKVELIGGYAFCERDGLVSVYAPNANTIGYDAFSGCDNLSTVNLPNALIIRSNAFDNCDQLTSVYIPNASVIEQYVFSNSKKLSAIYIDGPNVPTLRNINAFQGLPSDYRIYVDELIYDDWISATNWVNVSAHIEASPRFLGTEIELATDSTADNLYIYSGTLADGYSATTIDWGD